MVEEARTYFKTDKGVELCVTVLAVTQLGHAYFSITLRKGA
jgi:hypothetical protein